MRGQAGERAGGWADIGSGHGWAGGGERRRPRLPKWRRSGDNSSKYRGQQVAAATTWAMTAWAAWAAAWATEAAAAMAAACVTLLFN